MNERKMKIWNRIFRDLKIIFWGGFLLFMSLIGLLWFLRPDTSVIEKRTLTPFPDLTLRSFCDGSFFEKIDIWYADTYPLREKLIAGNHIMENLYGIRTTQLIKDGTVSELGELQGAVYITNHCGYGVYYFVPENANAFAHTMNEIHANIGDKVNLYLMICPISSGIMLDQAVLDDMGCSDQKEALAYIDARLDKDIHSISIYDTLKEHNAEYIYFHTDHHWTALGAYYAYVEFCKEKGIMPHNYRDYDTIELPNFLGSYYTSANRPQTLHDNPDTVIAYLPKGTNTMTVTTQDDTTIPWEIVRDISVDPNATALYSAFAGGDNPFSCAHNETITDGSAILIVKDSYGNALIPWLVDHYEYIYWIDARYGNTTVSEMIAEFGIQDVLWQTSIYNATAKTLLDQYTAIGQ